MKNIVLPLLFGLSSASQSGDIIALISEATLVGKLTLLILLIFSVVSWAVIIFKLSEYAKAKANSQKFIQFFRKTKNFSAINRFAASFQNNPLAVIYKYGYKELSMQLGAERSHNSNPALNPNSINVESLNRALIRASISEITRLERLNGFLATTATVTPFIGLFGTVWGIMTAFQQIGIHGIQMNANLQTVAPGIADALIATAMGLFAAVPAVIFYNFLLSKLKVLIANMEDFSMEFISVSEKAK
ncbi:MAG: protein TolQ [Candidatus Aminicenantes bacterium]|nr:protein TolQ [Candidatus Aminicenantes bacterium]NIM81208.1 protein TolQ [Candidatus Aminicenantes bacterium]NIN20583.1 protein TolQ [Candidatus Aminicenantes bacterium]NIN44362.1 protein TolQ [Candidatus Aminicenantes bacterium]NIN87181.1 protein TolQ [Candidatus Aminicenantes bacterium]